MRETGLFGRLRKRRTEAGPSDSSYKQWWTESSASEAGAYATTYVASSESDYRSRGWNGDANSFGARQFIEMAGLTSTSRVLEVGCGMARVGRELAPRVGEWHGADISANMLQFARSRTSHLGNVFLHELSDVSLHEFPASSFDFVYITTVLMHLDKEDVFQYLLETYRVLKEDGIAFFDTWNLLHPDTYRLWRAIQKDNIGSSKTRGRIQFSTASELARNLDEAGFDIVRFDEDRLLRVFGRKRLRNVIHPEDCVAPFGYVDCPANESVIGAELNVWGWALDAVDSVEVRIDGTQFLGRAQIGMPRPDVAPLFPRYEDAGRCGFSFVVPLDRQAPGRHTLQVIARDRSGLETDLCGNYRCVTFSE